MLYFTNTNKHDSLLTGRVAFSSASRKPSVRIYPPVLRTCWLSRPSGYGPRFPGVLSSEVFRWKAGLPGSIGVGFLKKILRRSSECGVVNRQNGRRLESIVF